MSDNKDLPQPSLDTITIIDLSKTLEKPEYRPVKTLDDLSDILLRMNCKSITKVINEKGTTAVRWTVDDRGEILGTGKKHKLVRRSIVFTFDEKGEIHYACQVDEKDFSTDSTNLVPNTLGWSRNVGERFTPADGTTFFLYSFINESHLPIARTDLFGFQFEEYKDRLGIRRKDVGVRIAGVKFKFTPTNKKQQALGGKASVEAPIV